MFDAIGQLRVCRKKSMESILSHLYPKVFRKDFIQPGFAVLDFGRDYSGGKLRATMVALKTALQMRCARETCHTLHYQWLGTFDQQATSRFHRDNAAAQSFLMLGYEPSTVKSRLFLADYLRFAKEHNISEDDYFAHHNPMYIEGEQSLAPYITEIEGFDASAYRIVLINNSSSTQDGATLGLLHKAEMVTPDPQASRIVNSMMLVFAAAGEVEQVSEEQVAAFLRGA
jgi:hypothetical protein